MADDEIGDFDETLDITFYGFKDDRNINFLLPTIAGRLYEETHPNQSSKGRIEVKEQCTVGTLADIILYTFIALIQKQILEQVSCDCGKCTDGPLLFTDRDKPAWHAHCKKILNKANIDECYKTLWWTDLNEVKDIVLTIYRANDDKTPVMDKNDKLVINGMLQQMLTCFTKQCLEENFYLVPSSLLNTVIHMKNEQYIHLQRVKWSLCKKDILG